MTKRGYALMMLAFLLSLLIVGFMLILGWGAGTLWIRGNIPNPLKLTPTPLPPHLISTPIPIGVLIPTPTSRPINSTQQAITQSPPSPTPTATTTATPTISPTPQPSYKRFLGGFSGTTLWIMTLVIIGCFIGLLGKVYTDN